MGEYVKYKGAEVKIGTCESLYYVTYPKFKEAFDQKLLTPSEFSVHPARCLEVDSGFLFRFPFPDEDKLAFGEIGKHGFNRGLPIKIVPGGDKDLIGLKDKPTDQEFTIHLIQQKFVRRESDGTPVMAAVFSEPESRKVFRIEEGSDILKIAGQIMEHHIVHESDRKLSMQYSQIATRMLAGYGLKPDMSLRNSLNNTKRRVKRSKQISKGRGL
ncbi:hypothetical protein SAMN05192529_10962 [Arachidicoccus rhizosphaerae]|uniref:Uncharacterized protein n=1 Tax=Arachidicoccus rhizosphaerae TaxID=551991 RepID=A0A1H3YVV3_9BACT|nr:hypothetical protein [Arachidicoccus rhizosphaerae]SEA15182.1 hypothetical protein SAMN05192529_10962 [Arachidicoccus rhizosphaerae]